MDLVIKCQQYISNNLTPIFASKLFLSINKPVMKSYIENVLEIIINNAYQLMMPDNIVNIPIDVVEYIFQTDNIIIGDEIIFLKSFVFLYQLYENNENICIRLNNLLHHIQWAFIREEEFESLICTLYGKSELLQIVNIIRVFYMNNVQLPPEFIYHNRYYNGYIPCNIYAFDMVMYRYYFTNNKNENFFISKEDEDDIVNSINNIPFFDYLNERYDWIREASLKIIKNISYRLNIFDVGKDIIKYCYTLYTMDSDNIKQDSLEILNNIFNNSDIIPNNIMIDCCHYIIYFYNVNKSLLFKSLEKGTGIFNLYNRRFNFINK